MASVLRGRKRQTDLEDDVMEAVKHFLARLLKDGKKVISPATEKRARDLIER